MQNLAKLRSIRKIKDTKGMVCRQVFTFGDESRDLLVVEIGWSDGAKMWMAEAYYYGTDFRECHWAQVFTEKKKALVRKLRMSVAVRRDPDLEKVNDAMFPKRMIYMDIDTGKTVTLGPLNKIGKPIEEDDLTVEYRF